MKLLIIAFLTAFVPSLCQARLGENVTELIARYGMPTNVIAPNEYYFLKAGLDIKATIHQEKCIMISFTRVEAEAPFLPVEVEALLEANKGNTGGWTQVESLSWKSMDGKRKGFLSAAHTILAISDRDGIKAWMASMDDDAKARLKDF